MFKKTSKCNEGDWTLSALLCEVITSIGGKLGGCSMETRQEFVLSDLVLYFVVWKFY